MSTNANVLTALEPQADLAEKRQGRGLGALLVLAEDAEKPLPLADVRVRASIIGDCCRTSMTQRYVNAHDTPLEALYVFPLAPGAAVTAMVLAAGDVEVRAECREREAAEAEFATAREQGHRAGLLSQERSDVYALRVTNLPPSTDVHVRIELVEQLESVDGRLRWRFPTVIPPRYLPGTPVGHEGPGILPDTDHVPDASRLQPPLRLAGGTPLDLEVAIHGPLSHLSSSLHAVRIDVDAGSEPHCRVAPSAKATLDRDFVIAFRASDSATYAARAWTDGTYALVLIEPPEHAEALALPRDAVFVIDVSGSMSGEKLDAARKALSSALHGLVPGDRFALIAFDDELYPFDEGLCDYDDANLARADHWISGLRARGGTEMLPAVRAALAGDTPEGRLRTVLLITDGQAWNEAELTAAVANRARSARLFTLGIDFAVNESLLKRLARAGGGTCELCTPSDDIEAAILSLEARFGTPLVDGVTIEGGEPARDAPLAIYAGRPASALLEGHPERVTVSMRSADGIVTQTVAALPAPFSLGPLWARERIAAIEDQIDLHPDQEEARRPDVIRIALAHGIASRYTAMVAVDRSTTVAGELVEVVQPVELAYGWDRAFLHASLQSVQCASRAMHVFSQADYMLANPSASSGVSALSPSDGLRRLLRRGGTRPPESAADTAVDAAARPAPRSDPVGDLTRRQTADGSFAGDVDRTSAALVALVLAGNTRRRGIRRRAVQKAAAWLASHADSHRAAMALDLLARAEGGEAPEQLALAQAEGLRDLVRAGDEGAALQAVLAELGAV